MKVTLRHFEMPDWPTCLRWSREIESFRYQSHIAPRNFNQRNLKGSEHWCWFIIEADGKETGTVWLEKKNTGDDMAFIGIMIGEKENFGKGIGKQAIKLAIAAAQDKLHFDTVGLEVRQSNLRAINCYKKCGFAIIAEGVKKNASGQDILFYSMRLELPNALLNL